MPYPVVGTTVLARVGDEVREFALVLAMDGTVRWDIYREEIE
jgi:hypothetical protein